MVIRDTRGGRRELRHKDVGVRIVTQCSSVESYPLPIRRKLPFDPAGKLRMRMFLEVIEPELGSRPLKTHVDQVASIWGPIVDNRASAFRHDLGFFGTFRGYHINVG